MKVYQSVTFHHEQDGRIYSASFPIPGPLQECYDVAATMANEFAKRLQEEAEKAKAAEAEKESAVEDAPVKEEAA